MLNVKFNRSKEIFKEKGWFSESPLTLVFVSSMLGGFMKAVIMTPMDVIVTRLYNQGFKTIETLFKCCFLAVLLHFNKHQSFNLICFV